MTSIVRDDRRGVTVVRLAGEIGLEEGESLSRHLFAALQATGGEVLLDLRSTRHIHYRVARVLAAIARDKGRLGLVGASPYVRQILRLAGALEGDLPEYRTFRDAAGNRAA